MNWLLVAGAAALLLLLGKRKETLIPTGRAEAPPDEPEFASWMFTFDGERPLTAAPERPENMVGFVSGRPTDELAAYAAAMSAAGVPNALDGGTLFVDATRTAEAGRIVRETERGLRA